MLNTGALIMNIPYPSKLVANDNVGHVDRWDNHECPGFRWYTVIVMRVYFGLLFARSDAFMTEQPNAAISSRSFGMS